MSQLIKWSLRLILLIIILLLSTQLETLFGSLGITQDYQRQITLTLFGSGLIGFFISISVILFQKDFNDFILKLTANNFYKNKLFIDISEVFKRDHLDWNYTSNQHIWVYDNSFINSLFDCYNTNNKFIWEYSSYISEDLFYLFEKFYKDTRNAYVESEKLDSMIRSRVTFFEEKLSITNHGHNVYYLYNRSKLFLPKNIDTIKIMLNPITDMNKEIVFENAEQIYLKLETDIKIKSQIIKVRKSSKMLIKEIEKIKKEVNLNSNKKG